MFFLRELTTILCLVSARAEYAAFDKLYEDGVSAYSNDDWGAAILNIEQSLEGYKEYIAGLSSCSNKCSNSLSVDAMHESYYLSKIFSKSMCVKSCLSQKFNDFKAVSRVSKEVLSDFEKYMPYQYLQFAYYKNDMLPESVSAAYTYHLKFPEDEMMSANIQFFQESEDVTKDMFVDREAKEHIVEYYSAIEAYLQEDYLKSVELFEGAIDKYFDSAVNCSGMCEGRDASADEQSEVIFYLQNAYHYIDVMECSLRCIQELSPKVKDQYETDFLPLIFHHLQHAYYQLDNFAKSAEYMLSYLLFHPNSTEMRENLDILAEEFNVTGITPSEKVIAIHQKGKLVAEMLQYSWNYFGMKTKEYDLLHFFKRQSTEPEPEEAVSRNLDEEFQENEAIGYENMKEKTDDIISKRAAEIEHAINKDSNVKEQQSEPLDDVDIQQLIDSESHIGYKVVDSKYIVTISDKAEEDPLSEGPLMFKGISLLANSSILKGGKRFAVDGLANELQCQDLINYAVGHGRPGDGYQGNESPHTKHEKFNGVTVFDAALAAEAGTLPLSAAKLYYDMSEKVRVQVQAYFHLPHLYFDFTHLVCRTAKAKTVRSDLSHPVHADNCLLQKNASCIKEPPAYIWRDYSAILYLNGDFDGGEFIFTDSTARRVRVNLIPKCGRMVSFSAGVDSLHGVKPVLHGRRCAIALWFTLSENRKEQRREKAKEIIDKLMTSSNQKEEL